MRKRKLESFTLLDSTTTKEGKNKKVSTLQLFKENSKKDRKYSFWNNENKINELNLDYIKLVKKEIDKQTKKKILLKNILRK